MTKINHLALRINENQKLEAFKRSRHCGYYHYATEWKPNKIGAILPLEPWTSDQTQAVKEAEELAKRGWPVILFWCGLDGRLRREMRIKP